MVLTVIPFLRWRWIMLLWRRFRPVSYRSRLVGILVGLACCRTLIGILDRSAKHTLRLLRLLRLYLADSRRRLWYRRAPRRLCRRHTERLARRLSTAGKPTVIVVCVVIRLTLVRRGHICRGSVKRKLIISRLEIYRKYLK